MASQSGNSYYAPAESDLKMIASPKLIVYSESLTGSPYTQIVAYGGGSSFALTSGVGNNYQPQFSPNGKYILFQSTRDHLDTGSSELYVMDWNGDNVRRLTFNQGAVGDVNWSSNSSTVAFTRYSEGFYGIYTLDINSSTEQKLTSATSNSEQPSWSPDGSKIVFASDREGISSIYVMNSDGTNQIEITNNSNVNDSPSWSPNGLRIIYSGRAEGSSFGELFVINADGSSNQQITNNINTGEVGMKWSPDSLKIVYTSSPLNGNRDVNIIDADGGNLVNNFNSSFYENEGSWSPQGNVLLFVSNRSGKYHIYQVGSSGQSLSQLTSGLGFYSNPTFQP